MILVTETDFAHARVGSYFLGFKAENFYVLSELMGKVLQDQQTVRQNLYRDDPSSSHLE